MNLLQFLPRRLPGVTASARTLDQRVPPPPPPPRLLPFRQRRSGVMSVLRPAWLLLAAVALLALVGALALPATTQAQSVGVLVSNLGETDAGYGIYLDDRGYLGQAFSVGAGGGDYILTSVEIPMSGAGMAVVDSSLLSVSVWSANSSGEPSSSLHPLMKPSSITVGTTATFTAATGATLEAGKTYVIVVFYNEAQSGNLQWRVVGTGEDADPATGWTIADEYFGGSATATNWVSYTGEAYRIRVNGRPGSMDATLSGLSVTGGGTDLVTFASGTTTYTAMVANDVAEVTVTAMTTDSGASIDYLDGSDMTLDDADTSDDGHQVTLVVGDTIIQVKVTAEDTTTLTYTVTVSRAEAATPPDAPTNFTATVGDTQVALAWKAAASDSGVTGHEFRYKTDGDYPLTWTAIADSGPDETNEDSFTVTGLTNEVAHTFELRAVNAAGGGGAATAEPVTPTPGICDRTEILHEYIVEALSGVDDCAAVTVADLAGLSRVDVGNYGITSLKSGDFAGLTSLTYLDLGLNSLAMLPEDVFSDLTALTRLHLNSTALSSLPEDVFSGLTALTRLDLSTNDLSSLDAGVFSELTSLTTLNLGLNSLAMLPEDVFSDLTALTRLDLYDNDLSSLHEDVFSDLTALTDLRLYNNDLSLLPGTVFSDLTALDILYLNDNDLNALPDELFTGLTSLTTLTLGSNSTNPMELTVTVEKVGANQVRAKVLAGAPFAVDLPVTLVDGTLEGSVTVLGVAAGEVDGAPVTVTRTSGTTTAVTVDVDLTTQPTRPTDHTGYIFKKATVNLPATILPDATNAAPAFTSSTTFNPAENQTAVGTVEAEDSDTADEITGYALNGGADQALFAINSGVLTFQAAPNYEDPQDANTDNAYEVVVRATSGTGARVKTMDQTITVTVMDEDEPPAAPGAPTVSATSGSATSLDVSWTAPANTGKPAITSYDLRYRVGDRESWTDGPQDETGTTATITGLAADTEHQVQVRASNDEGDSGWSAAGTGSTNADTDTPTVELEDRIQAINCALDALDGESDARCADIEGMSGSNRDLVALQLEVIGQLPPGKYDYYDLAGWQWLFKMGNGRVVITKAGAAGPAPLTARLTGIPEAHDGETAFRFLVAFSEDVGIDEQSLRDHSFTVSGGEVTGAQRDRHDLWEITVAPDSDGDVTITLPGDRECGTAGAVCTRGDDPSPLTNSPSATVAGPADDARDPNTAATGTPTISGTPQVGETLTADTSGISDEDGLNDAVFGYQWLAGGDAIEGPTGSTYTLADEDTGKAISVEVSFTDDAGNGESLTSAATDAVAAAPQANNEATGAPSISGTVQVGETLTADTSSIADADGISNAEFAYQWQADDTDISGATGSTHTLADANEGKAIKVKVSFTDEAGNDETLTSAATDPVAGNEESMTSKDAAAWSATMTVEWVYQGYGYYSTDTKKAGSLTPASFKVDGTTYTVKMVETQGWWTYIGVDRELPFDFVLELDGMRFASGDASFNSYSYGNIYRWEGTGLSLRDGDTVEVRLLRAFEDETAVNSPATGQPTISGTVQVGETLTADTSGIKDADGLDDVSFSYQWLAGDTAIQGATNADYTLADADEGKAVTVQVSFTDDGGNDETLTSTATAAVSAAPNNPATGAPTISGTAQVGETLTTDTSGIADEDGLTSVTHSYQWLAGDGAIAGATGTAYTLADADEGNTVKVRVSFTDDGGNDETLTSGATEAVAGNEESAVAREDAAAWSATMTVEWVYQGYGYYSTDSKKAGALAPASFNVDGTTYTVKMVETQGWWTYIGVDRELPFDFLLELDGMRFASGDASFNSYSYGNIYRWEGTGLSLRDGDAVEVRLLRAIEDETAVNSAATGAPIVSGTVQVGETLTADTSGVADEDGLNNAAFTYQWLADNAAIAGATGSTYTLADDDEGKAVKVRVSFTDDAGTDETLTSAATDAVAAATQPNNPATGAPTISGTAQVGETLTVDTTGIADADGLDNAAFTYQWLADDADIADATGSTYPLVEADEGKAVQGSGVFHRRRRQRRDAGQYGDGRGGGPGAACQAHRPFRHAVPRPGSPHLGRPQRRRHHRLRDPAPQSGDRRRGRVHQPGGGYRQRRDHLHRRHRGGGDSLHLPDQGHQRARDERAFALGACRDDRRAHPSGNSRA